jgi:Xaa-Pro aminopeptidase
MQSLQATTYLPETAVSRVRYAGRVEALRAKLEQEKLDAFLVSHFANRRFLSGYSANDLPPSETAGFLLITPNSAYLITNFLYAEAAREEAGPVGYEIVVLQPNQGYSQAVAKLVKEHGLKQVGFESIALVFEYFANITQALENAATLVATRGFVEELRLLKDEEELQLMRRAIAISDRAFDETLPLIRAGVTEKYIAWEIERRVREFGGEALAFETIVASGPNGATPHAVPGQRQLQEGEPLIIDMGARYRGYNSDMTRTVCVGEPTARFKEIYNIVLEAQLRSSEAIRPGLTGQQADAVARDIISGYGYGDNFGHALGHGIGLAVHEPPSLRANSQITLAPNMVHSIEPGIYLAGWGGVRIEDLVLVKPDGYENLTGAIKQGFYQ